MLLGHRYIGWSLVSFLRQIERILTVFTGCNSAVGPSKDGLQGFWEKASQNADIPSLIPHERWAIEPAYAPEVTVDKMYVRFAGFLPSVEAFDASAFR